MKERRGGKFVWWYRWKRRGEERKKERLQKEMKNWYQKDDWVDYTLLHETPETFNEIDMFNKYNVLSSVELAEKDSVSIFYWFCVLACLCSIRVSRILAEQKYSMEWKGYKRRMGKKMKVIIIITKVKWAVSIITWFFLFFYVRSARKPMSPFRLSVQYIPACMCM